MNVSFIGYYYIYLVAAVVIAGRLRHYDGAGGPVSVVVVNAVAVIGVGRGPSGPSIENPFCCTVHLCCALGDRKIGKKAKEKKRKKKKRERK